MASALFRDLAILVARIGLGVVFVADCWQKFFEIEVNATQTAMRPITVLDFANVAFINSAGISALLKVVVSARKAGNKLFAMNVSPHHQKIFKMVEMSRFMPTIEERDLAAYR